MTPRLPCLRSRYLSMYYLCTCPSCSEKTTAATCCIHPFVNLAWCIRTTMLFWKRNAKSRPKTDTPIQKPGRHFRSTALLWLPVPSFSFLVLGYSWVFFLLLSNHASFFAISAIGHGVLGDAAPLLENDGARCFFGGLFFFWLGAFWFTEY